MKKPARKDIVNYVKEDRLHLIVVGQSGPISCESGGTELKKATKQNDPDNSFSEDEEVLEEVQELPEVLAARKTKFRTSVSAEVYGQFNIQQTNWTPRVIAKSDEQTKRILTYMDKSFIFQNVDDDDRQVVADAFEIKEFEDQQTIIKENDDGDYFYVTGISIILQIGYPIIPIISHF